MRVVDHVIEYDTGESFTVYNLSDLHKGARNHRQDLLLRDVKTVAKDPNALWVSCGDLADAITPRDKRFRAHEVHPRYLADVENMPRMATDDITADLAPIASKGLVMVTGNHDEDLSARNYYHVPRAVCDRLGIAYGGSHAFIRLRFKRGTHVETVKIHVAHGSGGGATAGAAANYLEKQMAIVDAHVHFCGHFHRSAVVRKNLVTCPSSGKARVEKVPRVGVASGGYLDDYVLDAQSYVEDKSMPAWDLGMAGVRIKLEPLTLEVLA